jgi:hypothetical protein
MLLCSMTASLDGAGRRADRRSVTLPVDLVVRAST